MGSSPAECCDTLCGGYSCGKGYQADPLKARGGGGAWGWGHFLTILGVIKVRQWGCFPKNPTLRGLGGALGREHGNVLEQNATGVVGSTGVLGLASPNVYTSLRHS